MSGWIRAGVIAVVVASACQSGGGESAPTTTVAPPDAVAASTDVSDLYGDWTIGSVSVVGQSVIEPAPETGTPRLTFAEGSVTWRVCNSFSTTADIGPGSIDAGEEGTMTLIACPQADREALAAISTVFRRTEVSWSIADDQLRIDSGEDYVLASRA